MKRLVAFSLRVWPGTLVALVLAALAGSAVPSATLASPKPTTQWPMFGQSFTNTASVPATTIGTGNVGALKPKWAFTTSGDVSARPAVVNGVAYFPDWGGNLYAVNAANGRLLWQKNLLTAYLQGAFATPPAKVVSRTSPFYDAGSNTLFIGTQTGAYLLAIDAATGALKWRTQLDTHPLAIDTASPVDYNGVIYVGVASLEEGAAANPGYPCCSFRGSAVAVNATTGQILWKTYTAPAGYSGSSVWGSTPVVDAARNQVYVTTGNNYSTPTDPAYAACIAQPGATEGQCLSPDDHVDSVLALDMGTGAVKWAQRLSSGDDWTVACISGATPGEGNCPTGAGPDYDFGSGVNLFTITRGGIPETVVGAGQKSGIYSVFDATTGQLVWATQVGPGSSLGGIEWGSATDGSRIYVAMSDFNGTPYTLTPSGQTDTAGSWGALDAATGTILWQTADPNGAVDLGPVTVANGVVYAGSMGASTATTPNMVALNAATGNILWSYASGGSVIAGAALANDTVYWGSGYANLPIPGFVGNTKFYAFTLGGQ